MHNRSDVPIDGNMPEKSKKTSANEAKDLPKKKVATIQKKKEATVPKPRGAKSTIGAEGAAEAQTAVATNEKPTNRASAENSGSNSKPNESSIAETSASDGSNKRKPSAKTIIVPSRPEDERLPRSQRPMRPMFIRPEAVVTQKKAEGAAGKRTPHDPSAHGRGGRGRGRGGRGGQGSSHGAPRVKSTYTAEEIEQMQTCELLPSLALEEGSKAERRKRYEDADRAKNEKIVGYIDEKYVPKAKDPTKTGVTAYEDMWESDHEADEEGLAQLRLLQDILVDRGEVIPKCLPHKDMPEVIRAVNTDNIQSYVEPNICLKTGNVLPTPARSVNYLRKLGGTKLRSLHESNYRKPLLLQFPAGMSAFNKMLSQKEQQSVSGEDQLGKAATGIAAQDNDGSIFDDEYDHGMADIPGGTTIGKMVFTKKGRSYIKINGFKEKMDVSQSINENKIKNVMMFLPEIGDDEEHSAKNEDETKKGHMFGVADHFFVCSFDVAKICGAHRKDAAKKRDESEKADTDESGDVETTTQEIQAAIEKGTTVAPSGVQPDPEAKKLPQKRRGTFANR